MYVLLQFHFFTVGHLIDIFLKDKIRIVLETEADIRLSCPLSKKKNAYGVKVVPALCFQ